MDSRIKKNAQAKNKLDEKQECFSKGICSYELSEHILEFQPSLNSSIIGLSAST